MTQKLPQAVFAQSGSTPGSCSKTWPWLVALLACSLLYLVCLLSTTLPLYNNPIYSLPSQAWSSLKIIHLASKIPLPQNLRLDPDTVRSAHITNFWVFTLLIACMFITYGLGTVCLLCYKIQRHVWYILLFIFMIAIV